MRSIMCGVALSMAVLLPKIGNAQVYQFRTPPPPVTAQYAEWQFNNEPLLVNGLIYFPTRETRFFDGGIMMQVGVYRSVPVYADATLEPYSVIYVPVGRMLMRGYERRRSGELAGTQGSRVPAFPVDIATPNPPEPISPATLEAIATRGPEQTAPREAPIVDTLMSIPTRTYVESIRRPSEANGIWLEYRGSRYYSSGPAVNYSSVRFTQIGDYRGFGVYREHNGKPDQIWVRVVADGPVAPYSKR